jgi:tRNA-splicing endonuclease subunit Sen2
MNRIYALPAPIRTFPLPTFYPSNPISLLHLAYAWLSQVLRPPPQEPSVIHTGVWDPETRSVHVRDNSSIRALWEQGFYGKGSLSRSEPNWLKRELARRGSPEGKTVSEARTELRREERRLAKWERAKAELEALERQRLAEAASNDAASEATKVNGVLPETAIADTLANPAAVIPDVGGPSPVDAVSETTTEIAPAVEVTQTRKPEKQFEGHRQEPKPPVGPAELLALPNSLSKLSCAPNGVVFEQPVRRAVEHKAPVGPAELLLLPNSHADLVSRPVSGLAIFEIGQTAPSQPTPQTALHLNGHAISAPIDDKAEMNGVVNDHVVKTSASAGSQKADDRSGNGTHMNGAAVPPSSLLPDGPIFNLPTQETEGDVSQAMKRGVQDVEGVAAQASKRRKSVRFSPTVASTTFLHSDPPSPSRSADATSKSGGPSLPNGEVATLPNVLPAAPLVPENAPGLNGDANGDAATSLAEIENKEHFQLAPEEAFFLAFSLGALQVVDPVTGSPISTEDLLALFRTHSYFPPHAAGSLRPDDPFLVNYAVYHHFRSLGWVPRHGIKFGVDWIIYQRGPAFDHSEFGIMVLPAYSDAAWEGHEHEEPKRSWSWLMGVNRVLSHVLKSLVLVYVDIPTPVVFDEEMARGGIAAALKKYTIREVMVRRFSVNRNR